MDNPSIRILLLENNLKDAHALRRKLATVGVPFELVHARELDAALRSLGEKHFEIILLSVSSRESAGVLDWIHAQAASVPIIVLGEAEDPMQAVKLVREGAQDYLVKPNLRGDLLLRSMRYAIERHRLRDELRALSLQDELTGLYNRRGFVILAEQQLKLARRLKRQLVLLFADLDGLKQINDTFGHSEGDAALRQIAKILKDVFRSSDLIARVGGDEFIVVAMEAENPDGNALISRLTKMLNALAKQRTRRYPLTLSFGMIRYDPEHPKSLAELLARADKVMYSQKKKKRTRN